MIKLTEEEKNQAKQWRIKKCGSTDFKNLKKEFRKYIKIKDDNTSKTT